MPCLWIAIRLKLLGANGSPRMVSTRAASRGARPTFSASTRSPGCASPNSAIGSSRRSFFSTGRSQCDVPSRWTTPSTSSLPFSSFFIGWASQPLLPSSVRARMRSPMPSAAPRPLRSIILSRGGFPSASQRSGTAKARPASSTSITRSTVTFGTPPILWNARPGAASISPSSPMSRSSCLSATLSCPLSPKARAISRLPAGASDAAMKSRIC